MSAVSSSLVIFQRISVGGYRPLSKLRLQNLKTCRRRTMSLNFDHKAFPAKRTYVKREMLLFFSYGFSISILGTSLLYPTLIHIGQNQDSYASGRLSPITKPRDLVLAVQPEPVTYSTCPEWCNASRSQKYCVPICWNPSPGRLHCSTCNAWRLTDETKDAFDQNMSGSLTYCFWTSLHVIAEAQFYREHNSLSPAASAIESHIMASVFSMYTTLVTLWPFDRTVYYVSCTYQEIIARSVSPTESSVRSIMETSYVYLKTISHPVKWLSHQYWGFSLE